MSKTWKWILGVLGTLLVIAAAIAGILAWNHQDLRSALARAIAAQATPAGVNDVPVMMRPLWRLTIVLPYVLDAR